MIHADSREDIPDKAEHVQRPEGSAHPTASTSERQHSGWQGWRGQKRVCRGEAREGSGRGEMGAWPRIKKSTSGQLAAG